MKATRVAVLNSNIHDNKRNGVKFWKGGDLVNSFVVNHDADAAVVFDGGGDYRILNSLIAYVSMQTAASFRQLSCVSLMSIFLENFNSWIANFSSSSISCNPPIGTG